MSKLNKYRIINKYVTIILVIFFLFCFLQGISSANDKLVVGGDRIGPVTLGKTVAEYEAFLGKYNQISSNFIDCPSRKMLLHTQNGKIIGIMVYSSDYKTREGIKVGDSVSALVKEYGNYLKTEAGALTYSELGLAFNVKDDKISRIMVISAAPDQLLGDKVVVPGVRAGNIRIGDNAQNILNIWGRPDSIENSDKNPSVVSLRYKNKAVTIITVDGVVSGVVINSYKFRTSEGISIDSTFEQVAKTYGTEYKKVHNSIMYHSNGIGFYMHENKVIEILLTYRK
jgi:hypothetical protein